MTQVWVGEGFPPQAAKRVGAQCPRCRAPCGLSCLVVLILLKPLESLKIFPPSQPLLFIKPAEPVG